MSWRLRTISLLLVACVTPLAMAAGVTAADTVRELQQGLKDIDAALAPDDQVGRQQAVRELLLATHALDYMARLALGPGWRELDDSQRQQFLDAFRELSVASYAGNFVDIADVEFEIVDTRALRGERQEVRTLLRAPGKAPVALDYSLREQPDRGWLIIQVRADGVSDLALKRSQYTAVLASEGFDALLDYLAEQAAAALAD